MADRQILTDRVRADSERRDVVSDAVHLEPVHALAAVTPTVEGPRPVHRALAAGVSSGCTSTDPGQRDREHRSGQAHRYCSSCGSHLVLRSSRAGAYMGCFLHKPTRVTPRRRVRRAPRRRR
ncbi:MAG: topoisomerase DNA-binding C4 zinc finger domain-containing protein [Nocardia sp.]|nr:topoisomerase DNA-binding C4 zinc finger domain-containing protein [Nocardia sp.]